MATPWTVDAQAVDELRAAMRWYEAQRTGHGGRLLDDFEATLQTLREQPTLRIAPPGAPRGDGVGRARLARTDGSGAYRILSDQLCAPPETPRVLHGLPP